MGKNVADGMWEMLVSAGVQRCYGIVGDALNPVIDALRRNGSIDFVHVRHEEYGVFAAVADALLTGRPVAVCGTAGPGTAHLINGLMDARKERAPVIAIAGDTETGVMDSQTLEELNPYKFFDVAARYIGRIVNPAQLHHVVGNAVTVALAERGPTVISVPGDIAVLDAPKVPLRVPLPATKPGPANAADLSAMAQLINSANKVAIFGGDGCADAGAQVRTLARKLQAPVGYSLKGKQWLEYDNPNAVGMTGLLGYGGCWDAINKCDVLLMLGTDFPFTQFLPHGKVKVVQVDRDPGHLGRRIPLELAVLGDVEATVDALLPLVEVKSDSRFLDKCVKLTERSRKRLNHYVDAGPKTKPIRPEYLASILNEEADDDALFFADTGTAVIWASHHLDLGPNRRLMGSFSWASMANAAPNAFGAAMAFKGRQTIALCGDGGFTMLGLGDLLTQVQRKTPVVQVVLNNASLDFVHLEQQEAGFVPYGTDFRNPDFSKVAEAMGATGIRVEDPGDLRSAVRAALQHRDGPVVLDVLVDSYALALPAHVPAETATGFTLSQAKMILDGDAAEVAKNVTHNLKLL
ncbi:thiamine pyrophosphate-dependent enzyme [Nocardia huaxiensis]|uniref:Thiamine pyrophosphate-binding protein n=1 Tax=Nocardia huaxiensis TaxID=2755382 RepID=A0A7D6ZJX7_9NOCA|nr:thiamine pyrophosphate-dependent enzyme [Nocardia huaxiensis]QLY32447.1 thiamine pyrophosphate-binding protein [Nocardia huaxiensis]UFS93848.1 thiamine pyrophosphate-dependent enzyme [Nocardia huaxiensis]